MSVYVDFWKDTEFKIKEEKPLRELETEFLKSKKYKGRKIIGIFEYNPKKLNYNLQIADLTTKPYSNGNYLILTDKYDFTGNKRRQFSYIQQYVKASNEIAKIQDVAIERYGYRTGTSIVARKSLPEPVGLTEDLKKTVENDYVKKNTIVAKDYEKKNAIVAKFDKKTIEQINENPQETKEVKFQKALQYFNIDKSGVNGFIENFLKNLGSTLWSDEDDKLIDMYEKIKILFPSNNRFENVAYLIIETHKKFIETFGVDIRKARSDVMTAEKKTGKKHARCPKLLPVDILLRVYNKFPPTSCLEHVVKMLNLLLPDENIEYTDVFKKLDKAVNAKIVEETKTVVDAKALEEKAATESASPVNSQAEPELLSEDDKQSIKDKFTNTDDFKKHLQTEETNTIIDDSTGFLNDNTDITDFDTLLNNLNNWIIKEHNAKKVGVGTEAEEAEAERLRQETEGKAPEEAESERLRQETERKAAEEAEAERLRQETERKAAEKAAAEAEAKSAAEKALADAEAEKAPPKSTSTTLPPPPPLLPPPPPKADNGYIENQKGTLLCGQHAINHILQEGKIFKDTTTQEKIVLKQKSQDGKYEKSENPLAQNTELNLKGWCAELETFQKDNTGATTESMCNSNYENLRFDGVDLLLNTVLQYRTERAFGEDLLKKLQINLQKSKCLGVIINLGGFHYTAISKYYKQCKYTYIDSIKFLDGNGLNNYVNAKCFNEIEDVYQFASKLNMQGLIFVYDYYNAYESVSLIKLRSTRRVPNNEITDTELEGLETEFGKDESSFNVFIAALSDKQNRQTLPALNKFIYAIDKGIIKIRKISEFIRDNQIASIRDFVWVINDKIETHDIEVYGPEMPKLQNQSQSASPVNSQGQAEIEAEQKKKAEIEAERKRQAEIEAERKRQAEIEADQKRQAEIEAEKKRQAEIEAEQKRQAEIEAEQKRQAEIEAEQKRQAEIEAEKKRQAEIEAEQQRQAEIEAEQQRQAEIETERLRLEAERKAADDAGVLLTEEEIANLKQEFKDLESFKTYLQIENDIYPKISKYIDSKTFVNTNTDVNDYDTFLDLMNKKIAEEHYKEMTKKTPPPAEIEADQKRHETEKAAKQKETAKNNFFFNSGNKTLKKRDRKEPKNYQLYTDEGHQFVVKEDVPYQENLHFKPRVYQPEKNTQTNTVPLTETKSGPPAFKTQQNTELLIKPKVKMSDIQIAQSKAKEESEEAAKRLKQQEAEAEADRVKREAEADRLKQQEAEAERLKQQEAEAERLKQQETARQTEIKENSQKGYYKSQTTQFYGNISINNILQEEKIYQIEPPSGSKFLYKHDKQPPQNYEDLTMNVYAHWTLKDYCKYVNFCSDDGKHLSFYGVHTVLRDLGYNVRNLEHLDKDYEVYLQKKNCLGIILDLSAGHDAVVSKRYNTCQFAYMDSLTSSEPQCFETLNEVLEFLKTKMINKALYVGDVENESYESVASIKLREKGELLSSEKDAEETRELEEVYNNKIREAAAAAEQKRRAEEVAAAEEKRLKEEAAAAEEKRRAEEAAAAEEKKQEEAAADEKRRTEEAAAAEKKKQEEAAAEKQRKKDEEYEIQQAEYKRKNALQSEANAAAVKQEQENKKIKEALAEAAKQDELDPTKPLMTAQLTNLKNKFETETDLINFLISIKLNKVDNSLNSLNIDPNIIEKLRHVLTQKNPSTTNKESFLTSLGLGQFANKQKILEKLFTEPKKGGKRKTRKQRKKSLRHKTRNAINRL